MSWVTDLAKKTENILNKLDQNAATALQLPANTDNGDITSNFNAVQVNTPRKNLKNISKPLKVKHSTFKTLHPENMSSSQSFKNENTVNMSREEVSNIITDIANPVELSNPEVVTINMEESENAATNVVIETTKTNKNTIDNVSKLGSGDSLELAAFQIALTEVSSERDELRQRLATLIDNKGSQKRVEELDLLTRRLTEEREHLQRDIRELQTSNSAYIHSISELENNMTKMQQEYLDIAQKLQIQLKETELVRNDLREYRLKAQRALQTKDNLISELKKSGPLDGEQVAVDSDIRLLQMEFDALKQEHKQTLEENRNIVMQLETVRSDYNSLSTEQAALLTQMRTNDEKLRKELRTERENLSKSEAEQRSLTIDLDKLRQQLITEAAAAAEKLQIKETQLNQLKAKKLSDNNSELGELSLDDYDSRIKTLTQTLIEKQNAVEHITAERNALRIQLEKMQDQLQQTIHNANHNSAVAARNALLNNSTDDVKAQFPMLLRETPFDTNVTRRVKRAYSSLDSMGVRLGTFLRRYPLMRVFLLMYVGLMHLWVMFVLLSSTPN